MGKRLKTKVTVCKAHTRFLQIVHNKYDLLVVENVVEYEEKRLVRGLNAALIRSGQRRGSVWQAQAVNLDPHLFGFNVARARTYIILWRSDRLRWSTHVPDFAAIIEPVRAELSSKLSVHDYWWKGGLRVLG